LIISNRLARNPFYCIFMGGFWWCEEFTFRRKI